MRLQVRTKPDDTRARIVETAEVLFRRLGFAKTAIVQAICQRCLSEVEENAWAIARSKATASQRLERLVLEILAYHKENLLTEQRVNDIVLIALEQNWDEILAHK